MRIAPLSATAFRPAAMTTSGAGMAGFDFGYSGGRLVAGVDEVGRGSLAGPVVACALVLPAGDAMKSVEARGVRDSKKLTAKRRGELCAIIKSAALDFCVSAVGPAEIDEANILEATLEAMSRAIGGLSVAPAVVLVDGVHTPRCPYPAECVKGGDGLSVSIACASIVAKVHRDGLMAGYHEEFPEYGFAAHKGYGTARHDEAIRRHGLCPIHRRTFCSKFAPRLDLGNCAATLQRGDAGGS